MYWLPDWKIRDDQQFLELVGSETRKESWVVAGNYSIVREMLWPKADTIIWLNYPFIVVFYRAVVRSFKRALYKEKLFGGNVETFRQSFFSKKSIIVWVIRTYAEKRKRYPLLLNSELVKNAEIKVFTKPEELKSFLSKLEKQDVI